MTLGAVIALAALGCSVDPRTEVLVIVDAESATRAESDRLDVLVEGAPAGGSFAERLDETLREPIEWPITVAIVPEDGDTTRRFRVTATARRAELIVNQARVISGFVEGDTRVFRLMLSDGCAGTSCANEATCRDGACADAFVDPGALAPYAPADGGLDGGTDAFAPPDGCVAAPESCNAADDDCDGWIDETFALETDVANCGSCGRACAPGDHGSAACAAGDCTIACDDGFMDCDAAPGCETSIRNTMACGGCANACSPGQVCAPAGGIYVCSSGCAMPLTNCSGACVDTSNDPAHCAGCHNACPDVAHAREICAAASCGFECDPGYDDCDAMPANGCETRTATSTVHCGRCGGRCNLPNASPECREGECRIGACNPGFNDCTAAAGCETAHFLFADGDGDGFGSAWRVPGCAPAAGRVMSGGDCDDSDALAYPGAPEICNERDDDCDMATDETFDLDSDRQHCGVCGNVCPIRTTCLGGSCEAVGECIPPRPECL